MAEADCGSRDAGASGLGDVFEDLGFIDEAVVGLAVSQKDDPGDALLLHERRELLNAFLPAVEEGSGAA